jgi:hypothetical protein
MRSNREVARRITLGWERGFKAMLEVGFEDRKPLLRYNRCPKSLHQRCI